MTSKTVFFSFIFLCFVTLRFKDTDNHYTPINYSLFSYFRPAYYIALPKRDGGISDPVKHVYFGLLVYETFQPDVWMLKFRKNALLRISRLLNYTFPKSLYSPTSLRGIINWITV